MPRELSAPRRLHLLRHAKSAWDDPSLDDRDRPLSDRGRRAAVRLSGHIRCADVRPQIVLCSPSLRTRQTLALVFGSLTAQVRVDEALYHASLADLRRIVGEIPDRFDEAMLVGHNPGLQDLALDLARPGPLTDVIAEKLPTGSLVTLAAPVAHWHELAAGEVTIESFVRPRDLSHDLPSAGDPSQEPSAGSTK